MRFKFFGHIWTHSSLPSAEDEAPMKARRGGVDDLRRKRSSGLGRRSRAPSGWSVGKNRSGEGTDEEDKLPALIFGEASLEAGHGAAAFGDLVEDFAVGEVGSSPGVDEIGGERVMEPSFGAVAFAGRTVALRTVFVVDDAGGTEVGFGGRERIDAAFGGLGNDPLVMVLVERERDRDENEKEESGEEEFAQAESSLRRESHG